MNSPDHPRQLAARPQARVLQRLYLTLMFRGRLTGNKHHQTLRGPVASFVVAVLLFALLSLIALAFNSASFVTFAGCLHALTFLMVGMNLASSSGNILFSAEEADVLLHRPIEPRALLTAKVRVIVLVSLVLALALNLCGFILGMSREDGSWLFLPVHLVSLTLEVIFCASFVVLAYNLCLRWFGRERLENLMTSVQVLVAVSAIVGGQIVPRVIGKVNFEALSAKVSWLLALPPVWFGALDTVLMGRAVSPGLVGLAACGVITTVLTSWLGISRLAATYEQGLVMLNEVGPSATKSGARRGRIVKFLLRLPLVRTWLRDPVERSAFQLAAAEISRARGVKLRIYPMLAQFLAYPVIIFVGGAGRQRSMLDPLAIAFAGAFVSMIPLVVIDRLRTAEDWRAADLFRCAPLSRPSSLFHGTRKAVILMLCVPGMLLVVGLGLFWLRGQLETLLLILPGILAVPVFSLLPGLGKTYLPFSEQPELETHSSRGCLLSAFFMITSFVLTGLTAWAWARGWYKWMIVGEAVITFGLAAWINRSIDRRALRPEE